MKSAFELKLEPADACMSEESTSYDDPLFDKMQTQAEAQIIRDKRKKTSLSRKDFQ